MNIKKGDSVIIITGKDKGAKGKVVKSIPKESAVVVEGINMRKRHKKPTRSGAKGQVVEYAAPIHVSNVKLA